MSHINVFSFISSSADQRMRSFARFRSLILRHKRRLSPQSTSPSPNSRLATKTSDTLPRRMGARHFPRQRRYRLAWRFGGVRRISWRTGWCSGSSRTHNWGKLGFPMCCAICGKRNNHSSRNHDRWDRASSYRRLAHSLLSCDELIMATL